jgi:hypothetical protein
MPTAKQKQEFLTLVNTHVRDVRINGNGVTGRVPWREDNHPSFSANLNRTPLDGKC